MKGKITIECSETGTHVSVNMEELREHDTLFLMHTLGKTLELNAKDYYILCLAEAKGALTPGAIQTTNNISEVTYES